MVVDNSIVAPSIDEDDHIKYVVTQEYCSTCGNPPLKYECSRCFDFINCICLLCDQELCDCYCERSGGEVTNCKKNQEMTQHGFV